MDDQCGKLVTVVVHGGREAPRRAGLSAAAETYITKFEYVVTLQ